MLRAEGLAAIRGERLVFRDLGFTVDAGGALLLVGPNGSGKSTLLRLLAGLGRPAAGRLLWDGRDALEDVPAHAARVAYLGHQDSVKPGLTAAENLRFDAAKAAPPPHPVPLPRPGERERLLAVASPLSPRWGERVGVRGAAIAAALDALGLTVLAELPARLLSAGQRRRLALARLALSPAPLWLLDEPTLGLDTASVALLGPLLAAHRAGGGLIVAATHLALPLAGATELRLA